MSLPAAAPVSSLARRAARSLLAGLLVALAPWLAGCGGYRVGGLAHPQISSVRVAAPTNDTADPRLGPLVAQQVRARLSQDGSVSMVEDHSADAVLYTRVTSVAYNRQAADRAASRSQRNRVYRTTSYGVSVTVAYWLEIPGREPPALARRTATGYGTYSDYTDPEVMRHDALAQAMAEVAGQVVAGVTEGW